MKLPSRSGCPALFVLLLLLLLVCCRGSDEAAKTTLSSSSSSSSNDKVEEAPVVDREITSTGGGDVVGAADGVPSLARFGQLALSLRDSSTASKTRPATTTNEGWASKSPNVYERVQDSTAASAGEPYTGILPFDGKSDGTSATGVDGAAAEQSRRDRSLVSLRFCRKCKGNWKCIGRGCRHPNLLSKQKRIELCPSYCDGPVRTQWKTCIKARCWPTSTDQVINICVDEGNFCHNAQCCQQNGEFCHRVKSNAAKGSMATYEYLCLKGIETPKCSFVEGTACGGKTGKSCCKPLSCAPRNYQQTGAYTCQACTQELGTKCTGPSKSECCQPLGCRNDRCYPSSCSKDSDCGGMPDRCVDSQCVRPKQPINGPCDDGSDCLEGACVKGTCTLECTENSACNDLSREAVCVFGACYQAKQSKLERCDENEGTALYGDTSRLLIWFSIQLS